MQNWRLFFGFFGGFLVIHVNWRLVCWLFPPSLTTQNHCDMPHASTAHYSPPHSHYVSYRKRKHEETVLKKYLKILSYYYWVDYANISFVEKPRSFPHCAHFLVVALEGLQPRAGPSRRVLVEAVKRLLRESHLVLDPHGVERRAERILQAYVFSKSELERIFFEI